jgi:tripartite-type tricarboxylate transporter receptor subunit TctC
LLQAIAVALIAALAILTEARAQQPYPSQVIQIVAPYPAGQASDVAARVLADALRSRLGRPVIVENRPGASGIIGAVQAAKSTPDGHTLLMTSTSFTINTAVFANLAYDVGKDFKPVALLGSAPMALVVNPALPARDLSDFITLLKKDPGKHNFAHAGVGTIQNLTMELFLNTVGLQAMGVAYKGTPQALTDITAGHMPFMFDALSSSLGLILSGRVRALVQTGTERFPSLPNVPTAIDSGIPALKDFTVVGWVGLLAPAGTPDAIVARLNAEIAQVMQEENVREQFAKLGLIAHPPTTPQHFAEFLQKEIRRWAKAASLAKIERQ